MTSKLNMKTNHQIQCSCISIAPGHILRNIENVSCIFDTQSSKVLSLNFKCMCGLLLAHLSKAQVSLCTTIVYLSIFPFKWLFMNCYRDQLQAFHKCSWLSPDQVLLLFM